jgi:hypothetical protein
MTEPIHQYRIDRVAALRAVTIATQQGDRPKTIRPISPLMRQATVVTVDATTPPSCTIQFDTVTPGPTHPGTRYPNNLKLVTGDLVYTVTLGNGDTWVLTRLASGLTAPVQADVFSGSFSTASTTYTDLATPSSSPGPAVTVLMAAGQTVKVTVSARSWVSAVGATQANMAWAVSGAETRAAQDADATEQTDAQSGTMSKSGLYTAGVAGSRTITAKYKVIGATSANFTSRRLLVEP